MKKHIQMGEKGDDQWNKKMESQLEDSEEGEEREKWVEKAKGHIDDEKGETNNFPSNMIIYLSTSIISKGALE